MDLVQQLSVGSSGFHLTQPHSRRGGAFSQDPSPNKKSAKKDFSTDSSIYFKNQLKSKKRDDSSETPEVHMLRVDTGEGETTLEASQREESIGYAIQKL